MEQSIARQVTMMQLLGWTITQFLKRVAEFEYPKLCAAGKREYLPSAWGREKVLGTAYGAVAHVQRSGDLQLNAFCLAAFGGQAKQLT
ncbi:hypothetical protein CYMTET_48435 [Cymbomonas tetramitiformis]|uniref:Uncharacterized protein n=1 Tax=Cymbomonas tetramitiformis TaxID=36881 RepID=A0AAE0EVR6_9CHLO|nr:hypothetical protein CYMTET_48435 [Cymbomonas tetramitiformis]